MSRVAVLSVAVLLCLATGANAQEEQDAAAGVPVRYGQASPEQLDARLDTLLSMRSEAQAALEARLVRDREALRASAPPVELDTLEVGLMLVLTPSDQRRRANRLFTDVWDRHFALIEHSPTLTRVPFTFEWYDEEIGDRPRVRVDRATTAITFEGHHREAHVKEAIRNAVAAALDHDLRESDAAVARWVTGNPFDGHDWERTYRLLALAESKATRACLTEDTDGCVSALDIRSEPDPTGRLRAWYTADERRSLVARNRRLADNRIDRGLWDDCTVRRDVAVCDHILLDLYPRDWAPLPGSARETLVAYALERGGPGAWERLTEDPAMDPVEALQYASALPIGELVDGWRSRVVEHRPDSYDHLATKTTIAFAWVLVFAAFAMRSTRWRLG